MCEFVGSCNMWQLFYLKSYADCHADVNPYNVSKRLMHAAVSNGSCCLLYDYLILVIVLVHNAAIASIAYSWTPKS